ncbi:MAG: flagellar hook-basal body complex protein FliE [Negativicutes bacterium]|nr:flagellar hook-basal body complex protein FliE [Negativicutes bacterium]
MKVDSLKLSPAGVSRILPDESTDSPKGTQSFGEVLANALGDVNKLQQDAQQASVNLATGKIQDVSEVVVATEKATIALQLTMQVRNKVVDAYQEIMRMQV